MAIVFKSIKANKVKDDIYRLEFLNAMHKVERGMLKDYKACTANWEHEVTFEHMVSTRGGNLEVLVDTNDEIFGYVDRGTEAHDIEPKAADGVLIFPWDGYGSHIAKTVPNWVGTFPERIPGTTVYKKIVHHPGNEPRNFTKIIQEDWQRQFSDLMLEALHNANVKSGHAIK